MPSLSVGVDISEPWPSDLPNHCWQSWFPTAIFSGLVSPSGGLPLLTSRCLSSHHARLVSGGRFRIGSARGFFERSASVASLSGAPFTEPVVSGSCAQHPSAQPNDARRTRRKFPMSRLQGLKNSRFIGARFEASMQAERLTPATRSNFGSFVQWHLSGTPLKT